MPVGDKYYRLFSASGKALTNYTKSKRDIKLAKDFYRKFRRYKNMKVKIYYSDKPL